MRKSLELQAQMGPVFDVTLDNEDGAPVGGEAEHAQLIAELVMSAQNRHGRVGARVLPVDHPAFEQVVETVVGAAGGRVAYLMLPKVRGLADLQRAVGVDRCGGGAGGAAARDTAARAGRDPRRAARGVRAGRASAHRVAVVRPDGLRLGAPRCDPAGGDERRRPVLAPAGGACQARDRGRLPCQRQGAVALRGDRVQAQPRRCRKRPARRRVSSATPGCGASIRRRSSRSSRPSRRARPRSTRRSRSSGLPRRPTGRRSATTTRCTTAPATATSGR